MPSTDGVSIMVATGRGGSEWGSCPNRGLGLGTQIWEARRSESENEAEVDTTVMGDAVPVESSMLDLEAEGGCQWRDAFLSAVTAGDVSLEERLDLRHPPPTGTLRRTPPIVQ